MNDGDDNDAESVVSEASSVVCLFSSFVHFCYSLSRQLSLALSLVILTLVSLILQMARKS
jgi:hypothetical protein